jgi:hypothetical protein
VDSNHRRRKPADLQSAPIGRSGIPPAKSQRLKGCYAILSRNCRAIHLLFSVRVQLNGSSVDRVQPSARTDQVTFLFPDWHFAFYGVDNEAAGLESLIAMRAANADPNRDFTKRQFT